MAERNEVLSLFLELAAIPSPPGEERAVADVVLRYLHGLGLAADSARAALPRLRRRGRRPGARARRLDRRRALVSP